VELDDFKALNPQLSRPVILAAGTPQILLPWDNATVFKRNFEAHDAGKFATWTAWSAPTTMTVSEAARRVGMNENELRTVNSIPPRMLIKAGSVLIVPRKGNTQADVAGHVADNAQLSLSPEAATRRTVVKAAKRDTVTSIATRYKLSPAQVAEWNDVATSASFRPGQQVVLHLPARGRSEVHVTSRNVKQVSTTAPSKPATKKKAKPKAKKS
jgi:membrane-bound lytic murein transglycosylase D